MARLTDEQRLLRSVSEASWQKQVEQTLALAGFDLIYHTHDSRRSRKGFPDLVAIRDTEPDGLTLVAVELKRETGQATTEQFRWLEAFATIGDVVNRLECGVRIITDLWRPSDAERLWSLLQEGREER